MSDFLVEPVKDQSRLARLAEHLTEIPVIALDIETIDWWNRHQERIALIQIAYRSGMELKVAVIDALALESLEPLRLPLEQQTPLKVIHNAAFDATRLAAHYRFQVAPIHDTMVAARLNKEKKYSLQAQALVHLNLHLDKGAQRSDWSRRPLSAPQLSYAATDAAVTLQLFEHQQQRKLFGNYRLRNDSAAPKQTRLPLNLDSLTTTAQTKVQIPDSRRAAAVKENDILPTAEAADSADVSLAVLALLGIVAELPSRYGPEQLAVSVGVQQRVGLAGWIVDRTLGIEEDFAEETAKLALSELCEQQLVRVNLTGRLEATTDGTNLWKKLKTI